MKYYLAFPIVEHNLVLDDEQGKDLHLTVGFMADGSKLNEIKQYFEAHLPRVTNNYESLDRRCYGNAHEWPIDPDNQGNFHKYVRMTFIAGTGLQLYDQARAVFVRKIMAPREVTHTYTPHLSLFKATKDTLKDASVAMKMVKLVQNNQHTRDNSRYVKLGELTLFSIDDEGRHKAVEAVENVFGALTLE